MSQYKKGQSLQASTVVRFGLAIFLIAAIIAIMGAGFSDIADQSIGVLLQN